MALEKLKYLGDYINGQFVTSNRPDGEFRDVSPSDLSDEIMKLEFDYTHVAKACVAAREAFRSWSLTPLETRISYMRKLKEVYLAHEKEIATLIARETGKPLWESATEAKAMIN